MGHRDRARSKDHRFHSKEVRRTVQQFLNEAIEARTNGDDIDYQLEQHPIREVAWQVY